MKIGIFRALAVVAVTAAFASLGAPQSGPGGKRRPGGGGSGGGGGEQRPPIERQPERRPPERPVERQPERRPPERQPDRQPERPPMREPERQPDRQPDRSPSGGGSVILPPSGGSREGEGRPGGGTRPGGIQGYQRGTRPTISSQSGSVNYGTVSNWGSRGRVDRVRIDRAPIIIDNGVLSRRVNRVENVSLIVNGIRIGYYHYNRDWRDDWFVYPHYVFDPFAFNRPCYTSPWYYYPSLPAYVAPTRVIILDQFPSQNWIGSPYQWNRGNNWDRSWSRNDVDFALEDLQDAFERTDRRAATRLIPRNGRVNIYTDGRYSYSLNADDFYDLFMDGLYNADTRRYEIVDVRMGNRGDTARVTARHESLDPWGNTQVVFHDYFLERDRRDFVIREFGTSISRGRW